MSQYRCWGRMSAVVLILIGGTTATAQSIDPKVDLATPRATMRTFLDAVDEDRLKDAAKCLDLSGSDEKEAESRGPESARKLKDVLDRMWHVRYERIPDQADFGQPYNLAFQVEGLSAEDTADATKIVLARSKEDGLWRFSSETVTAIDNLWKRWESRREVAGLSKSFSAWLQERFPERFRQVHFLLPDYQWLCLLVLIFLGFLTDLLVRFSLTRLTAAWVRYFRGDSEAAVNVRLWRPVGLLSQALVWYAGTTMIGMPDFALRVLLVGLKFFAVVAGVWTSFLLIDLLSRYLMRKALGTSTKFDDLLVPLVSKSLKIFAVCVGVLMCAEAFNLPIAGLLGGLGIGGAALAFASKDAISNLFGSVTVLTDRPFEIGDWVITEGVEGSVETVGFRSTRIRTFYNSLITLPNSRLTTAVVDNMGRRRYRRIKMMLGVQYDTSPAQIEAFCEGIRELIGRHPYTRKDYYHVYFNELGDSSLNILLYCFLECPDWSVELQEKHRLLLDILRLAAQLDVSFAFPTRTLHLFQEQQADSDLPADVKDTD